MPSPSSLALATSLLSLASLTSAKPPAHIHTLGHSKAASTLTWGPIVQLGPCAGAATIIGVTSTSYPGNPPASQAGGLFNWIGINNYQTGGDLIQSIVGQYQPGASECEGADEDKLWCISSEVYGKSDDSSGAQMQFVGTDLSLDSAPANGIIFNYTLEDSSSGLWTQSATDAQTGAQLASYQKRSLGTMTTVTTAVECQSCTAPVDEQTWENTVIRLSSADASFGGTISPSHGATYTEPVTRDGGRTWTIEKITVPVVQPSTL